jgi:hypothetical protein
MARGPINQKQLAIESYYGYLNIHLELLHKALLDKSEEIIEFQKSQITAARKALMKLGYFEGRK